MISLFVLASTALAEAPLAPSNVVIVEDATNIEVDYSNFDDEDQDTIVENTDTITIKNNNNETIMVVLEATGLPADYASTSKEVTLEPNEAKLITDFSLNISHEQDSGETNIGSVIIKGINGVELDSSPLVQNTVSMLSLEEFKVEYNDKKGNSEKDTFDDLVDTDYKLDSEVQAGSVIEFTFDLENLFDNNYDEDDAEIEDIVIKIDPSDNDLFEDFDDEVDVDNIAAEDSESLTIELTLDSEVDDDTYDVDFEIEGDDGKGNTHTLAFNLEFEVDHSKNDVRIVRAEISPETITTCTEQISLNLKIENLGSEDQDFVDVAIYNEELKIDEDWGTFNLEEFSDDETSKTKAFLFDVSKLTKKSYNLDVYVYIDTDDLMDSEVVSFNVGECQLDIPEETEEEEEETTDSTVIVTTLDPEETSGTESETQQVSSSTIVATTENSYTTEDFLIGAVIIAIILIVALIIVFFVVLLK
jgi:hypothetical protein